MQANSETEDLRTYTRKSNFSHKSFDYKVKYVAEKVNICSCQDQQ